MSLVLVIARVTARVCALLAVIIGLGLWLGYFGGLLQLHMVLGIVFVASMLVIGAATAMRGASKSASALLFVLSICVAILGIKQVVLLAGSPYHWTVRVLHLVLAMGTLALGLRLAKARHEPKALSGPQAEAAPSEVSKP